MKKLLALGAGLAILCGAALAQSISVPLVTGVSAADLFQDVVGGQPQAQSQYATAGQIGNTTSVSLTVPLTAFTITQGVGTTWTIIQPAGTLATGTFTFNASPTNGSRACFVSTQTQTAVTFTGNTGQTVVGAPTAMVANTAVCFVYVASTSTWYKS